MLRYSEEALYIFTSVLFGGGDSLEYASVSIVYPICSVSAFLFSCVLVWLIPEARIIFRGIHLMYCNWVTDLEFVEEYYSWPEPHNSSSRLQTEFCTKLSAGLEIKSWTNFSGFHNPYTNGETETSA